VNLKNVTKDYGVLVLAGPKSRKVLSQLTSQNLNNNDFPWLKGKEIIINKIPVRALRVNYVGELGWELHHPMSQMESLYDSIYETGKKENIINFGTNAISLFQIVDDKIHLSISAIHGDAMVNGTGLLAAFEVTGLSSGTSTFTIVPEELHFIDDNGNEVDITDYLEVRDLTVTIP